MANEGSTKPTYSELEAENLRVRGLLQRVKELLDKGWSSPKEMAVAVGEVTSLIAGAESADIGKLDTADKSGGADASSR